MDRLIKSREARALQAVSTLRTLDRVINSSDLNRREASGHVTALARSLGHDDLFAGGEYFEHEIASGTHDISMIRQHLATVGLRMPLQYPTEESYAVIADSPGYLPAALQLMRWAMDGHDRCVSSADEVLKADPRLEAGERRHCQRLAVARFALGSDIPLIDQVESYTVYGESFIRFRRQMAGELFVATIIDKETYNKALDKIGIITEVYEPDM